MMVGPDGWGVEAFQAALDAALLPDPLDDDSIADALRCIVNDAELRATLVARGTECVRRYTWERAGPEFAALYRQVAAE
jgi:glycosyltransferase involved in cell wall biosynthesis